MENRVVLEGIYKEKTPSRYSHKFYLVKPLNFNKSKKYSLNVILHSNGNDAYSALLNGLKSKTEFETTYSDVFTLFIDCSVDKARDGWWGWHHIETREEKFASKLHEAELRVIATTNWVIQNFSVNRDHVHLYGISMGGSAALGIGVPRGDIFATVSAVVPAGVSHGIRRLKYPVPRLVEDYPPIFFYFSHLDHHEKNYEEYFKVVEKYNLQASFVWGDQDHDPSIKKLDVYNLFMFQKKISHKNPYIAFSGATGNSFYPGFGNRSVSPQFGQINAQFRWEIIEDSETRLKFKVWLEPMSEKYQSQLRQTANLSIKRLQRFNQKKSRLSCAQFRSNEKLLQKSNMTIQECLKNVSVTLEPLFVDITH